VEVVAHRIQIAKVILETHARSVRTMYVLLCVVLDVLEILIAQEEGIHAQSALQNEPVSIQFLNVEAFVEDMIVLASFLQESVEVSSNNAAFVIHPILQKDVETSQQAVNHIVERIVQVILIVLEPVEDVFTVNRMNVLLHHHYVVQYVVDQANAKQVQPALNVLVTFALNLLHVVKCVCQVDNVKATQGIVKHA